MAPQPTNTRAFTPINTTMATDTATTTATATSTPTEPTVLMDVISYVYDPLNRFTSADYVYMNISCYYSGMFLDAPRVAV